MTAFYNDCEDEALAIDDIVRRPRASGTKLARLEALATKEEIRGRWFVPEFGKGAMLGGLRWRWRLDKAAKTHVHKRGVRGRMSGTLPFR
jgi:hypothetical protein